MKFKIIPSVLISALFWFACGKVGEQMDTYEIEGYSTGFFEGKAVLYRVENGTLLPEDSVMVKKSRFKFKKHSVEHPQLMYLVLGDREAVIELFVENKRMRLDIDLANLSEPGLDGSVSQELFSEYLENNTAYENRLQELSNQIVAARLSSDSLMILSALTEERAILSEQKKFMVNFVQKHQNSYVSAYILANGLRRELGADSLLILSEQLSDTIRKSFYIKDIHNAIAIKKRLEIGKQAPDFSLPDTSGVKVSLASKQGSKILLTFGKSNCGICRSDFQKLKKFHTKGTTELLSISMDADASRLKKVLKADNPAGQFLCDFKGENSDIVQLYDINRLPMYYYLDEKGIIKAKSENLDDILTAIGSK